MAIFVIICTLLASKLTWQLTLVGFDVPFFKFKEPPPAAGVGRAGSTPRRRLGSGEGAIGMREKYAKNHFTRGMRKRRTKGARGREFELREVSTEMPPESSIHREIQVFPR